MAGEPETEYRCTACFMPAPPGHVCKHEDITAAVNWRGEYQRTAKAEAVKKVTALTKRLMAGGCPSEAVEYALEGARETLERARSAAKKGTP